MQRQVHLNKCKNGSPPMTAKHLDSASRSVAQGGWHNTYDIVLNNGGWGYTLTSALLGRVRAVCWQRFC